MNVAALTIYEKARLAGLDARTIAKSQARMTHVIGQQLEVHRCLDQVILHAAMYDYPTKIIHFKILGIGCWRPNADGVVELL